MENIRVFESIDELSYNLGQFLCKLTKSNQPLNIVLSGGSTPGYVFEYWSTRFRKKIQWKNINFFWSDERCVPSDHPDSNFKMTYEKLLQPLGIEERQIFRMIGENDPAKEAIRYSESILKTVKLQNNLPSFDLILLGIGEDGHTASIFPDQLSLLGSDKICDFAIHPDTGQKRITMTGKVLNNAEQIIFLVTGVSKRHIVKDIIKEPGNWTSYPAACIQPTNGKLHWYLDKKAASLIY